MRVASWISSLLPQAEQIHDSTGKAHSGATATDRIGQAAEVTLASNTSRSGIAQNVAPLGPLIRAKLANSHVDIFPVGFQNAIQDIAIGVVHHRITRPVIQEIDKLLLLFFAQIVDNIQYQLLAIAGVSFPLMAISQRLDANIELVVRSPLAEPHGHDLAIEVFRILVHDVEVAVAGDVASRLLGDNSLVAVQADDHGVAVDGDRVHRDRRLGLGRLVVLPAAGYEEEAAQHQDDADGESVALHGFPPKFENRERGN